MPWLSITIAAPGTRAPLAPFTVLAIARCSLSGRTMKKLDWTALSEQLSVLIDQVNSLAHRHVIVGLIAFPFAAKSFLESPADKSEEVFRGPKR